jgi:hypothetical protein
MPRTTSAPSVLIRAARGSDGAALSRLAALDSAAPASRSLVAASLAAGELLVAEADGALVAARAVRSGATLADPFSATADVVALLALRAGSLTGAPARPRLAERLGLRAGRMVSHTA